MHDHRNRHLEHFLRKASLRLALMQTTQGNIGTLRDTALTIQALQDLNVIPNAAWNQAAASKWILDRQREDGSWVSGTCFVVAYTIFPPFFVVFFC